VYVSQPPGFEKEGYEHKVYKLNKSLNDLREAPRAMDHNIIENRLVFMKTDKISGDRFCRFNENRSVKFEFVENLGNFEIKNSKKTRVYFKIFGQK
jgi:hypothetical protein